MKPRETEREKLLKKYPWMKNQDPYEIAASTPTEEEIKEAKEDLIKFNLLKQSVLQALQTEMDRICSKYQTGNDNNEVDRLVGYRVGAINFSLSAIKTEECNSANNILLALENLRSLSKESTGRSLGSFGLFFNKLLGIFKPSGYENISNIIDSVNNFIEKEAIKKDEAYIKKHCSPY